MNSLELNALNTVKGADLLRPNDTVYVALSGGADSVALLHVMLALREVLQLSDVRALHVNHGIRGDSADNDERFVRELCDKLRVPLNVKRVDVPAVVAQTGESVEDAARRLRYAFFEEEIKSVPFSKLATAHSADDQAETVLLHLIRGSGSTGASGIPVKRGNIIRPLLECAASDIRSYCAEKELPYVEDETNADVRYARNRVRHEILPAMRCINPSVTRSLVRFSQVLTEEDRFMKSLADELIASASVAENCFSVKVLTSADPALRRRVLYRLCRAEYLHVDRLDTCLRDGGTVNLPGDRRAVSDGITLQLLQCSRHRSTIAEYSFPVLTDKAIRIGDIYYVPRLISYEEYSENLKIHKNLFDFCISYDMIEHDLVLRSRKAGDQLRPFGRGCTKTLKKLMNDYHIPPDQRSAYPIVAGGDKVLMVLGLCVDESVAVTPSAKIVLWFEQRMIDTNS